MLNFPVPDLIQKCLGHCGIMARVQPETGQLMHSRSNVLHLIRFHSSKEHLDHTVQRYQPETAGAGSTVPVLHQGWGHTQERYHLLHLRRRLGPVLPFLLCIKDRTTLSSVPFPEATADSSTVPVLHQGRGHTQRRSHLFRLRRWLGPVLLFLFYIKGGATHKDVLTCSFSRGHCRQFYCSCSTSRMGPHTKTFSPVPPPEAAGVGSTVPALHPGQGHTREDVLTRSASGGCQTQFHPSCSTSRTGPTHKKTFSPVPPPEAAGSGPTLPALSQGRRPRSHLLLLQLNGVQLPLQLLLQALQLRSVFAGGRVVGPQHALVVLRLPQVLLQRGDGARQRHHLLLVRLLGLHVLPAQQQQQK